MLSICPRQPEARGKITYRPGGGVAYFYNVGATCGRPWACEARLVAEDYAPANSHPKRVGILAAPSLLLPKPNPLALASVWFLYFDAAARFGCRRGTAGVRSTPLQGYGLIPGV